MRSHPDLRSLLMPCIYGQLVVPRAAHAAVLGEKTGKKKINNQSCANLSGAWGDFYDLMEEAHSAVC